MAIETECQTPDAKFVTVIRERLVLVGVRTPFPLDLSEGQAEELEANLHNAIELVLKPYFNKRSV